MYNHALWLVDYQYVIILVEYVKRNVLWQDRCLYGFRYCDIYYVFSLLPVICLFGLILDQYLIFF